MDIFDGIEQSEFDSIEEKVFNEYNNAGLPINIIDLAEKYDLKTVIFKNPKKIIKSQLISTSILSKFVKIELGKEITLIIGLSTDDALEQRINVAYHLANMILFLNNKIDAEKVVERSRVEKEIPMNSGYIFALSLLCPKDKVISILNNNGYDKTNYKEISDYSIFTKSFLVNSNDFAFRLKFLFEGVDEVEK